MVALHLRGCWLCGATLDRGSLAVLADISPPRYWTPSTLPMAADCSQDWSAPSLKPRLVFAIGSRAGMMPTPPSTGGPASRRAGCGRWRLGRAGRTSGCRSVPTSSPGQLTAATRFPGSGLASSPHRRWRCSGCRARQVLVRGPADHRSGAPGRRVSGYRKGGVLPSGSGSRRSDDQVWAGLPAEPARPRRGG